MCTAGTGVVSAFEDEDGRALAEDEPVTVGVEGPAGLFGAFGTGRQGPHPGEACGSRACPTRFAAAGQDDVAGPAQEQVTGDADGGGAGCAGAGHGEVGSAGSGVDGDLARDHAGHAAGQRQR